MRRPCTAALLAAVFTAAPAAATAQNIALGKPAFALDQAGADQGPEKAVDGVTDGNFYNPASIYHSRTFDGGWWYVDLGADYDLSRIVLWNRTDCCDTRIIGATVGLFAAAPFGAGGPAPVESWTVGSSDASQTLTSASGAVGRYVGIERRGITLNFAEMEVFGARAIQPPVSTVPEPGTVALVGAGLAAVGAAARRRARA